MKKYISLIILIMLLCSMHTFAIADDEVTLFDGRGKATAYIDLDDEFTIYLWSGKPVAYLKRDSYDLEVEKGPGIY